jgi:archaetidylinositol phosphate synthase
MLDGRWKHVQDTWWDAIARPLAKTGVTANQVTLGGTALMLTHSAAFCVHRDVFWFGVGIAVLELSDDLDGAIARVTGTTSAFGAYLDATTDRYKEVGAYAALGYVLGAWPLAFACMAGAMLTSYAKARAAMEKPLSNEKWPDLFERLERIVILCAGLIFTDFVPHVFFGHSLLMATLVVLAVGTHGTAIQRFFRARSWLTS